MAHYITDANGNLIKVAGNYGKLPDEVFNNMKPVLLWTNPKPTSSFSPQTVTIDLDYDIFVFRVKNTTTTNLYRDFFVLKNIEPTFRFQSIANIGTQNRNGNEFVSNGVYLGEGINNNARDDTVCLPYKIFGIKLGV